MKIVHALSLVGLFAVAGCAGLTHLGSVDPVQTLMAEGKHRFAAGQYEQSLDLFSRAIERAPSDPETWNARGFVHGRQGRWIEAAKDFRHAVAPDGTQSRYVNNLGVALLEGGETDEALVVLTQAVRLAPESPLPLVHRGLAHRRLGHLDDAMSDFSRAVELDPHHAVAYANRAVVYALRQEFDHATRDLDRAASLNNQLSEVYESRALVHLLSGRPHQAVKDFSRAIALGSTDSELYYHRAMAYTLLGDTRQAHADYERSCRLGYPSACSSNMLLAAVSNPRS